MSDLRKIHHERSRQWVSLKKRLSGSSRRVSTLDRCVDTAGAIGSFPLPLKCRAKKTETAAVRLACTKSEGATSREICSGGQACLATPITSRSTALPSLLCTPSKKFSPLDDDSLSTIPLTGLASRYNRHYGETWLANYAGSSARKLKPHSTSVTDIDQHDASSPAPHKQLEKIPEQSMEKSQSSLGGLGDEIARITETLNRANVGGDRCSGRRYHVSDFDVKSVTSRTSSTAPSGFSFEADFSQFGDSAFQPTSSEMVEEEAWRLIEDCQLDSEVASQQVEIDCFLSDNKAMALEQNRCTTKSFSAKQHMKSQGKAWMREEVNTNGNQQPPSFFQPVIAGLSHKDEILAYNDSMADLPKLSNDYYNDDESRDACHVRNIRWKTEPIFRSTNVISDGPGARKRRYDEKEDEDEEYYDDPTLVSMDSEKEFFIQHICLSHDESIPISELTEGIASEEHHVDHKGVQPLQWGNSCKKAKCVVFYNEPFNHSEHHLSDGIHMKVKDMVCKLESMKRLEAHHAEKFGYRDFLPIHEHDERAKSTTNAVSTRSMQHQRTKEDSIHLGLSETCSF